VNDAFGSEGQSPVEAGPGPYQGKVLFEMFEPLNGTLNPSYDLFVYFSPQGDLTSVLGCSPGAVTMGACCYLSPGALDAGTPSVQNQVSAGTVTLFDNGTTLVSLMFGANGYDANNATISQGWVEGDQLAVAATGATVASLRQWPVLAPPAVSAPGIGPTVNVSVSKDWTVQWGHAATSTSMFIGQIGAAGAAVKCVVDDTAGTLTFPAALLSRFPTTGTAGAAFARVNVATGTTANASVEIATLTGIQPAIQLMP
jgi:hypothetical protein